MCDISDNGRPAIEPQLNRSVRTSARCAAYCESVSIERQLVSRKVWRMEPGFDLGRRRLLALLGMAGGAVRFGGSHPSLETRLTAEYGVRYPFVSAGMGFVSYPPLVTAVSNAGGIGVLGNAVEPPPSTEQLIRMIAQETSGLFGVDLLHDTTTFGPATTDAHIDVCAAEGVRLVVFHMTVPPREWVARLHAAGCRVWHQAPS